MPKDKYYDYLKPQAQAPTFSDVIEQQINLISQRKSQEAAQQMQGAIQQRKIQDEQAKELYGFDVDDLSQLDREVFNAKKQWMKDRIDSYYYSGANRDEFMEDVSTLNARFNELKAHSDNTKNERAKLEGWVSGTTPWTDSVNELKDDVNSYNLKLSQWEQGGIDPSSVQIDPTSGDAYANYTDINGNPLLDEQGNPQFGLVHQSPTRGSKEYFTPTTSPYPNLLPGEYSKDFSAATTRLRKNDELTPEQREEILVKWVTTSAMSNPSAVATSQSVFDQNYGPAAAAAIQEDAKLDPGDGSYVPIQMREYVEETMKFLRGNLVETKNSDGSSNGSGRSDAFPGSVYFDYSLFQPSFGSYVPDSHPTALMVPKSTSGRSNIVVEAVYDPSLFPGERANMSANNYRVAAVGMDVNRHLFVLAETYVEAEMSEFTPEQLEELRGLPGVSIDLESKMVRSKKEFPIMVEPTTININGSSEANQEWISIVAQIGRNAGVKDDRKAQVLKGMQMLDDWNDEAAQINASLQTGQ